MKTCAIFILCLIAGCSDNKPDEYVTYSKVTETITLTDGSCANIMLTMVCSGHACSRHVTSIEVSCP